MTIGELRVEFANDENTFFAGSQINGIVKFRVLENTEVKGKIIIDEG